jgi:hypothetical protein
MFQKDCLYFPWPVIFLALVGSLSVSNGLAYQAFVTMAGSRNVCVSSHSWANVSAVKHCKGSSFEGHLLGWVLPRGFVVKNSWHNFLLLLILRWSVIFVIATACWTLPWSVTKTVLYSRALINLIPLLTTDLHDESKTDLSLWHKCCEKFHVFQGWTRHFYYIRRLCYRFLPHNSYRMPQNYNRQSCELSCSCTHRFSWISLVCLY